MTRPIRLVLTLHNHQPIGNFDGVFESAYRESYLPFLDVLEKYPDLNVVLHTSGSLLEWLVERHPEYIDRVRNLAQRGQVEIIGGPFFEPILASIPRRDRIGQIRAYTDYLERLFGTRIRGMWVPERVWEQSFASDLVDAGMEYTILDDFHFRNAGLRDDELRGYYLTEDEGRLLKIFPVAERLRYTIPFAEPHESIEYLRQIADQTPNAVITVGDDGEKFGSWPQTFDHVYTHGWIYRFFDALRANADWLKLTTLSEVIDQVPPVGKIYIPDGSYREMTEWALPTDRQQSYFSLVNEMRQHPQWSRIQSFSRGGFWRNFKVKYPETNEMYCRMLEVSQRLEELEQQGSAATRPELLQQGRLELYRAQCNCSYWHGSFGGLYLPHLRNAVYRHLIAADTLLEQAQGRSGNWVEVEASDYNLDARKEVRIASDRLIAYCQPARGGHLYELDLRSIRHNLLATLNRRPEMYHETIRAAGLQHGEGGLPSQHDGVRFKQADLHRRIGYDSWPRKLFVDHFLQPGVTRERFQQGEGLISDFATGVYETLIRRSPQHVQLCLSRTGQVGPYPVSVRKTIELDRSANSQGLSVLYELENLPAGLPFDFGVEMNFAGMAANAPDRFFYDADGQTLGQLQSELTLQDCNRLGLVDEWLGLDVAIDLSQSAEVWTFPIQTISQSEGGFEGVHQSTVVMPHWQFQAPADGRWSVRLALTLDTSAAQARSLREAATVGT